MDKFDFKSRVPYLMLMAVCCVLVLDMAGQSITQLQHQAEKSLRRGQFADAAAQFERAGRIKNSDPALLFKAAEAYNQVRDYVNASNCYRAAMEDSKFHLAGLYFARALKQQGRYIEALSAFRKTGESYTGDHKEVILQVVENEVAGCDLAAKLLEQYDSTVVNTSLAWLPPPVSNADNSFAPLPFSDTLLYFTQARNPQSVMMRSVRRAGVWGAAVAAEGLPEVASKNFLCGSFSSNGQRFYFARCDKPPLASKGSSVGAEDCALFVIRRNASGEWGTPERLRSYINLAGSSNTMPYVCDFGDEEWLFFASNRPGGMGGMDLYVCERPLLADDFDFSFPLNLGTKVNTGADETTPYYDAFSKTLWFSSMGHPSIGGLDVHHTTGEGNDWTGTENAGTPINSPADDLYFVLKRDGSGAFLSSNRAVPKEKASTSDDDLFEIFFPHN